MVGVWGARPLMNGNKENEKAMGVGAGAFAPLCVRKERIPYTGNFPNF